MKFYLLRKKQQHETPIKNETDSLQLKNNSVGGKLTGMHLNLSSHTHSFTSKSCPVAGEFYLLYLCCVISFSPQVFGAEGIHI